MKRRQPPELPVHTIAVRPLKGAVVYHRDIDGRIKSIPIGAWMRVAVLPDIMIAIRSGDLEKQPGSEQTTIGPKPATRVLVKSPPQGQAEPYSGPLPPLTVELWKGAAERKAAEVAAEPPTDDPPVIVPSTTGKPRGEAKTPGISPRVIEAVTAVIALVDSGRTVIGAAREVGPRLGYINPTQVRTLARLYRRHHQKIRKDMQTAERLSARPRTVR